ncbi:MAG: cellulase family glycosylhydrolase [Treponema sp.]|jgi:endoglucanase|nr:cellulase family glycosylhydrolase [Treponema sp.]
MKKLFLLFLIVPLLWVGSCSSDSGSSISVSLDKSNVTLVVGKTTKLTATVNPADTPNKAITWSTSNAGIATVSGGTVTAVAEGKTTIIVTTKDGGKTATCAVTVTARPITDIGAKDGLSGKTAAEYFKEKNVFIGWNLGNAFDAGSGYGSWTKKIDKDFLSKVKEEGFSMVRVPVTWNINARPIGAAPAYTLNQDTLNDLVQVVDWAYDAGLVTIINIHHDGSQNGTTFNSGTTSWLSLLRLRQNQTERDTATARFVKVWEQIADKFKDYGDWLIFEPFNELHNGGWGWGTIQPVEFEIINDLNQKFTNTVRSAGGKNTERFLVVQPYCAKPHQALEDTFVLPTDTATSKQIVSMHYYDPEDFALRGNSVNWGSESDKIRLTDDFNSYANKFSKNGIPVILGECGATYQNRDPQSATAHANRLLYMDWMCRQAKENNIIPVYWDNGTTSASTIGENFGLWDRRSNGDLEVIPGMQEIIDKMIKAVQ